MRSTEKETGTRGGEFDMGRGKFRENRVKIIKNITFTITKSDYNQK